MRADNNIESAINQAQHLEVIRSGSSNPYADPGRSNREYQNNTQYVPMELDATKTRPSIKCYNCRKLGHIKRNCKSPLKPRTFPNKPRTFNQLRATYTQGEEEVRNEEMEQKITAQQDAIDTMMKLVDGMNEERRKDSVKDF